MALVRLTNGTDVKLSHEQGIRVWQILNGQAEPSAKESNFCELVKKIYLDWHTAPADYVLDRADVLRSMYSGEGLKKLEQRIKWAEGEIA